MNNSAEKSKKNKILPKLQWVIPIVKAFCKNGKITKIFVIIELLGTLWQTFTTAQKLEISL